MKYLYTVSVFWLLIAASALAKPLPVPPIPPSHAPKPQLVAAPAAKVHHPVRRVVVAQKPRTAPVPVSFPPITDAAPTPDRDARPPVDRDAASRMGVSITDFRASSPDSSAGFGSGTRYRSAEDVKAVQTPGLKLTLPLRLP